MTASNFYIELKIVHVAGKNNPVADLLSRWHVTVNLLSKLQEMLQTFQEIEVTQDMFQIDYEI